MNGYIEAGYSVVLGSLAVYAGILVRRERVARHRLGPVAGDPPLPAPAVEWTDAGPGARPAEPVTRAGTAEMVEPVTQAEMVEPVTPAGQPDAVR